MRRLTNSRIIAAFCSAALAVLLIFTWAPPGASAAEPQVSDNGDVTFNIKALNATQVTVMGEFRWGQDPLPLQKSASGMWSVTVKGLTPDFYDYSFFVDGVRTVDPSNPLIKQGNTSVASMFLIPGKEVSYAMNQMVPHGEITQLWYHSSTLNEQRRMHVYTPPGYSKSQQSYPVLYLLHGGGEDDSGWSTVGRAGFILDNLIAAGKAVPMLLVMPNGDLPLGASPAEVFGKPATPFAIEVRAKRERKFVVEFINDVIPMVEKRYRVYKDPAHRAVAGLSMGAAYSAEILKKNPLDLAYYGIWSMGFFFLDAQKFSAESPNLVKQIDKVNKNVRLISSMVGNKDMARNGATKLNGVLKELGLHTEFAMSEGGHTWVNWRAYLRDFAPRLFK